MYVKINRYVALAALAVVFLGLLATSAYATPGRTGLCNQCHYGVDVPITASALSNNGSLATYGFSAPSADAVAVFDGSVKVATVESSSGQFTVATGKTYTVYAVAGPSTNGGIGSTTVSPTAPATDLIAPTTTSDAKSSYSGQATIELTASDNAGGSGVAATYYKVDGGATVAGTQVTVSSAGDHTLEFWSVDVAGNTESHRSVMFTITSPTTPPTTPPPASSTGFVSVAGATRYETAVKASQLAFPTGAPCVIIATGSNWPDALGGGAFAAAKGGPVLLTDSRTLPFAVAAEIERLGASKAYILGGTGAVSEGVGAALGTMLGVGNVERIGGANRYQTAELIAVATVEELAKTGSYDGTAFVATGSNFPDALAATPLSAAKSWPLFLSGPAGLSEPTKAAMAACGVDEVVILGGTGVVPAAVEAGLAASYGGSAVTRLAGANRYATAVAVAEYGRDHAGLSLDGVAIATGDNFPDALAGGVMQGTTGSVMLLTPTRTLHAETAGCLSAAKSEITQLKYLGGTGAVSTAVRNEVSALLN